MPDNSARSDRIHIDSLRIRVPGRDAAAGQQFATELTASLAAQANSLLSDFPGQSIRLGAIKLAVPAQRMASDSRSVGTTILQAIANAATATRTG